MPPEDAAQEAARDAVRVVTHGCRLNAAESATVLAHARASGSNALIVHNTCAVTGEAVRSARQAIRRSARENPHARIVVTGCAAHTERDAFAAMPEVDAVVGNSEKLQAETWRTLPDFGVADTHKLRVNDAALTRAHAPHLALPELTEGRARAFLAVQNGCDHSCTFCIIPTGRGASRSVPMGAVVDAAKRLRDRGVAEIALTGVDLTSWGSDLPGRPALGALVQSLLRNVPDLPRIRLSSIDGAEADEALWDALPDPRFAPHLHLSLQHGHDLILKRMKRRHTRDDAIAFCERARALRPAIAFGADLIAGFPTETDAHHAANLSLIEACGIAHLHAFAFSPREGTPAARMPQVDRNTVKRRAAELRATGQRAHAAHIASRIGSTDRAVVHHGRDGEGRRTALAGDFTTLALGFDAEPGTIIDVRIVSVENGRLVAERI